MEAGSSATQLASGSQSCLVCVSRTHRPCDQRCGLEGVGVAALGGEDDVGEPPFQAAEGFAFGLPGGAFAVVVGAAFGAGPDLGERERVEGAVELPVAAGVAAVPDRAPGRRW